MSGLAIMFDQNQKGVPELEFGQFVQRVSHTKQLGKPSMTAGDRACRAAKFDASGALHRGICVDPASDSWLVAAGTVIDTADVAPDGNLSALLRDYLLHGPSVLARLDGIFALAIYDARTCILSLVSDPFGYSSVFYAEHGPNTLVSTSALAIAQHIRAAPSELGVQCFLRTGKVFGDMTLWQGVKRLRPATVLHVDTKGARESTYWTPSIDPSLSQLGLRDAVERTADFLPAVLKRNLAREGTVWSDLTGGFDTRFLTVLMERAGLPFKVNFVGPPNHPDVLVAKQIVERTGWNHQHLELPPTWTKDSPTFLQEALFRGDGHLNVLLMTRPLWVHHHEQEQFSTLLSGLGGEMWRGPNWWSERANIGRTSIVHYERQLWSLMHPIPEEVMRENSRLLVETELTRQFQQVGERFQDAPNTFKLDNVWTYRETGHVGAWSSLAAGLLRVIPPLFSKDIVNFTMSLDPRWRVKNSLVKHVFKKYSPELAAIDIEGRGPAAPLGFDNWYRYIPSRLTLARKAVDKFSQVAFGRTLWGNSRPVGYSRAEWRQEVIEYLAPEGILDPARMRSAKLYQPQQLQSLVARARAEGFKEEEFLGRIITIEMALRAGD